MGPAAGPRAKPPRGPRGSRATRHPERIDQRAQPLRLRDQGRSSCARLSTGGKGSAVQVKAGTNDTSSRVTACEQQEQRASSHPSAPAAPPASRLRSRRRAPARSPGPGAGRDHRGPAPPHGAPGQQGEPASIQPSRPWPGVVAIQPRSDDLRGHHPEPAAEDVRGARTRRGRS